ncbi:sigma factor [Streptomyces sp. NPDC016566]|uniref:sigma factor n=1 Tax=Streptomyces sp. NPDC016566 TaxID=3364967 RepID=UPI0036F66BE4
MIRLRGEYLRDALVKIITDNRASAEDILQETLVRAWQRPEAVGDSPERARPWLLTVARRIAIDHFRKKAARPQTGTDEIPEQCRIEADLFGECCSRTTCRRRLPRFSPGSARS